MYKRLRSRLPWVGADPAGAEERAIDAVREYVARRYPTPDPRRVLRIVRSYGLREVPPALLIAGSLRDNSAAGANASLRRALTPLSGGFGDPHPLFSSAYYLYANSDVASAGVPPWAHYQVYGRQEARSPHPLLDPAYMASWLPEVPESRVVDTVLRDRTLWLVETSPYVDAHRFALESRSSDRLPVEQALMSDTPSRWLSFKLMVIDAGSADHQSARRAAAIFLISKNSRLAAQLVLQEWAPPSAEPDAGLETSRSYSVIPGYFLGASGHCLRVLGDHAISPDFTMVRLPDGFLGVARGPRHRASTLVFVASDLDFSRLQELIKDRHGLVIAPRTEGQRQALESIRRKWASDATILKPGDQARVDADAVEIIDSMVEEVAMWDPGAPSDPHDVLFVLAPRNEAGKHDIHEWVEQGASILVLDESKLDAWSTFFSKPVIVVDSELIEIMVGFVEPSRLRLLPSEGAE